MTVKLPYTFSKGMVFDFYHAQKMTGTGELLLTDKASICPKKPHRH